MAQVSEDTKETLVKKEITSDTFHIPDIVKLPNVNKEPFDFNQVFKVVEQMPRFPGCYDGTEKELRECASNKLLEHIYFDISYPKKARRKRIQGTVLIRFVVDTTGEILDIECVKSIGGGCDEVALRVIESMPNWVPGHHKGKPVKVQFNLPIKFKL